MCLSHFPSVFFTGQAKTNAKATAGNGGQKRNKSICMRQWMLMGWQVVPHVWRAPCIKMSYGQTTVKVHQESTQSLLNDDVRLVIMNIWLNVPSAFLILDVPCKLHTSSSGAISTWSCESVVLRHVIQVCGVRSNHYAKPELVLLENQSHVHLWCTVIVPEEQTHVVHVEYWEHQHSCTIQLDKMETASFSTQRQ